MRDAGLKAETGETLHYTRCLAAPPPPRLSAEHARSLLRGMRGLRTERLPPGPGHSQTRPGPAPPGGGRLPGALTSGTRRPPRRPHRGQAPPRTPKPGVLPAPRALPAQADGLSRPRACARPLSSGADHGGEGVSGRPTPG